MLSLRAIQHPWVPREHIMNNQQIKNLKPGDTFRYHNTNDKKLYRVVEIIYVTGSRMYFNAEAIDKQGDTIAPPHGHSWTYELTGGSVALIRIFL